MLITFVLETGTPYATGVDVSARGVNFVLPGTTYGSARRSVGSRGNLKTL